MNSTSKSTLIILAGILIASAAVGSAIFFAESPKERLARLRPVLKDEQSLPPATGPASEALPIANESPPVEREPASPLEQPLLAKTAEPSEQADAVTRQEAALEPKPLPEPQREAEQVSAEPHFATRNGYFDEYGRPYRSRAMLEKYKQQYRMAQIKRAREDVFVALRIEPDIESDSVDRQIASDEDAVESANKEQAPKNTSNVATSSAPLSVYGSDETVGLTVFGAVGMNYLQYDQTFSDVSTTYRDLAGLSTHFGLVMDVSTHTALSAAYKTTPMHFDNSGAGYAGLDDVWKTLALHAETQVIRSLAQKIAQNGDATLLYGLQVHSIPLAFFEIGTNQPRMRTVQYFNASLGGRFSYEMMRKTLGEIELRAQYPLIAQATSSSVDFENKPKFSFDGSIGVKKLIRNNVSVGLYWYGQLQTMALKYRDAVVEAAGDQSAFFSNIEARVGVSF